MDATAWSPRTWAALCLGAALAAPLAAQDRPEDAEQPQAPPGQVLSDAQPLPAEYRDSQGAVVLKNAPVRAQQQQLRDAAERTGIPSAVGRGVSRLIERARSWDDVREADAGSAAQ